MKLRIIMMSELAILKSVLNSLPFYAYMSKILLFFIRVEMSKMRMKMF